MLYVVVFTPASHLFKREDNGPKRQLHSEKDVSQPQIFMVSKNFCFALYITQCPWAEAESCPNTTAYVTDIYFFIDISI